MKSTKFILLGLLLATCILSHGQVGVDNTDPHPSSVMDLNATDKGLLIPRMTSTQRLAISSPANSLLVFDSTLNLYFYFFSGQWHPLNPWIPSTTTSDISYNSGNVGIGTNSPGGKLHIFGNNPTTTNLILSADYADAYRWRMNTVDRGSAIDLDFTSSNSIDAETTVLSLTHPISGRPEFRLYNDAIVANDGYVGIGTSSPTSKLHVVGGLRTTENISAGLYVTVDKAGSYRVALNGMADGYIAGRDDMLNDKFIISSNGVSYFNGGNVGLGTAAPGARLHVLDGGIRHGGSGEINIDAVGVIGGRFKILDNGNIGIGNTAPPDKLQIGTQGFTNLKVGRWGAFGETGGAYATILGNNVRASTTTNATMEYIQTTVDGAKAIKMQYNEGISFHTYYGNVTAGQAFTGFERMRINNDGNVGIGTTSPGYKLDVNGSINASALYINGSSVSTGTIPAGVIVMWSGSTASIPSGWALCDGGQYGSVTAPDLRERFIVGAGGDNPNVAGGISYPSGYSNGNNGGSASTTQVPNHTHTYSDGYYVENSGTLSSPLVPGSSLESIGGSYRGAGSTDSDNNTIVYRSKASGNPNTGVSAVDNRPPFYALAFILKLP